MKSKIDQYQYVSSAKLPTHWGKFHIHGFIDNELAQEHIALSYGQWDAEDIVPIRIHSECLTGDAERIVSGKSILVHFFSPPHRGIFTARGCGEKQWKRIETA